MIVIVEYSPFLLVQFKPRRKRRRRRPSAPGPKRVQYAVPTAAQRRAVYRMLGLSGEGFCR
jgi:hypothetical protein